jgi:UDP-N-acetylglucosamine 4-epimerase
MNITLLDKKILVNERAGFIGSSFCEELLFRKNKVVCLDNFYIGKRENLRHLLANKKFTLVEGDIRNLGDSESMPKTEDIIGKLLSSYAVNK